MKKSKNNKSQIQEAVVLSAYNKQVVQDVFYMTMEALEKYIEKANYYSDWQVRRKIHDNKVTREFGSIEEAESVLSSNLVGLKMTLRNKPPFIVDELKEEYYKWINATGIDVDNITLQAERLKHWLFEVNEVLNGKGERFFQEVKKECSEHVQKMSSEEYERKMNEAFVSYNPQLNKERGIADSLEGKTYKDVESEKRFGGDNEKERGERAFGLIADTVAGKHDNFDYYQKNQKSTSSGGDTLLSILNEVVQDIKNNPKNYNVDEIPTEIDKFGRTKKKEVVAYCGHARLDDYDRQGKLNFNNNPIYRWESFNSYQRFEIKKVKNISGDYLTEEEIKWVVREFKDSPGVWKIVVDKGQTYLAHNSAQGKDKQEWGTLIHNQQKFSEIEWTEVNETLAKVDYIKQNMKLEKGLFVIDLQTGEKSEGEEWFIDNQLERKIDNQTGYLIYNSNSMIRAKDLSEGEQKAVGYKLENEISQQSTQSSRPQGGSKGFFSSPYVWGSLSIVSIVGLAFIR